MTLDDDVCSSTHPVFCKCETCVSPKRIFDSTHNQHLDHVRCSLKRGHSEPHCFYLPDGTSAHREATEILIGRLYIPEQVNQNYIVPTHSFSVFAIRLYDVTMPMALTSNGDASLVARSINHYVERYSARWEGCGVSGPGLASSLRRAYFEAYPEEYSSCVRAYGWDLRGPSFQWPE